MFSRRVLRIKAIQHLYAFFIQKKATSGIPTNSLTNRITQIQYEAQDLQNLKKSLEREVQKIKNTQLQFLQLLVAWVRIDQERANALLTPPTSTLAQNSFLKLLAHDATFIHLCEMHPLTIPDYLIEAWYDECLKLHPSFLAYKQQTKHTPEQDIELVNVFIKKILFKNKIIQQYVGKQDIGWGENKLIVKRLLFTLIGTFLEDPAVCFFLYTKEIPIEGADFYEKLVSKTVEKDAIYQKHMVEKLQNWDLTRVTLLDHLLIKMALTEVLYFTDIPSSVSINEYLDISKQYSTQKSYLFINGMLEPLIAELTDKINTLN